jgi:hypothetical protein
MSHDSHGHWAICAWLCTTLSCTADPPEAAPKDDGTIALTGYIFTSVQVPDLQIAAYELPEVAPATPDDEGVFTLTGLPRGQPFVVAASGQGIVATLQLVSPSEEDIYGYRAMAPLSGGTTYPDGIGADQADVLALVQRHGYLRSGLALTQVALTPPAVFGPDYFNDSTATDLSGRAFFQGVAPSEVQLTVAADRPCTAPGGWEGDGEQSTRVPVAPGHLTIVETLCPDLTDSRLVQGKVTDGDSSDPIVEASICAAEDSCATTNEAGVYELEIADGSDRVLSMTADGYAPLWQAIPNEWEANGVLTLVGMTLTRMANLASAAGTTQDPDRALLWIRANGSAWDGALNPEPADGLVYLDKDDTPDLSLTAASIGGQAFAPNVDPGAVALSLSHPGLDCRATTAWEWSAEPVQLPTAAGTVTSVRVVCFPAAPP